MKHVLKVGSYLFLTGEIELGHGVAYQGASESSGSSCRPVHVPCPTEEFASNARRGGGADYVVSRTVFAGCAGGSRFVPTNTHLLSLGQLLHKLL